MLTTTAQHMPTHTQSPTPCEREEITRHLACLAESLGVSLPSMEQAASARNDATLAKAFATDDALENEMGLRMAVTHLSEAILTLTASWIQQS